MSFNNYFYNGQNAVQIRLTDLGSLTNAVTCLIKYKTPAGVSGSFSATIENSTTGIIFYNLTNSQFLTTGEWTFWAHVTFSDGRIGIGQTKFITIKNEGE
jgi:hypothetical protein